VQRHACVLACVCVCACLGKCVPVCVLGMHACLHLCVCACLGKRLPVFVFLCVCFVPPTAFCHCDLFTSGPPRTRSHKFARRAPPQPHAPPSPPQFLLQSLSAAAAAARAAAVRDGGYPSLEHCVASPSGTVFVSIASFCCKKLLALQVQC